MSQNSFGRLSQNSQTSFGRLSQISGISDILPDVDEFVENQGMVEEVRYLMADEEEGAKNVVVDQVVDARDMKLTPEDLDLYSVQNCSGNFVNAIQQYPPILQANFSSEIFPGEFNFKAIITQSIGPKPTWEFSQKMNKIFIKMGETFPVEFNVENRSDLNLFIRVTPAYSQPQFFDENVYRCIEHHHHTSPYNKDLPQHVINHVVRCSNGASKYFGDRAKNERLSIVLPLDVPITGRKTVKEFFYCVCKHSCQSGINRRTTQLIFTLENLRGQVLGRDVLNLRICSAPKRDKEKEEHTEIDNETKPPKSKKKKLINKENDDTKNITMDNRIYYLGEVPIVGQDSLKSLLTYGMMLMGEKTVNAQNNGLSDNIYKDCHQKISALIEKLPK